MDGAAWSGATTIYDGSSAIESLVVTDRANGEWAWR